MTLDDAKVSIDRYVEHGLRPGGFLTAVLENDLMGAIGHGDDSSIASLQAICRYIYNDIPAGAWGSREKMEKWQIRIHAAKAQVGA